MKNALLIALGVFVLASFLAQPAAADTVTFVVTPDKVGPLFSGGSVDLFSPGLNGTALSGQALSLDLVFQPGMLARLAMLSPQVFGVNLNIFTNGGFPGFVGPATTGYLLDAAGNQFGPSQSAGRSASDDGTFNMSLVNFTNPSMVDIRGAHFDTSLPGTGFLITNAQLQFTLNDENSVRFGTAQQLPESNSLVLLGVGLVAVGVIIRFVRKRSA